MRKLRTGHLSVCVCAFVLIGIFLLKFDTLHAQNPEIKGKLVSPLYKRILAVCKAVQENGRTTETLTAGDFTKLPVGLIKTVGENRYVIAIDSAYYNERGWFFTAYCMLTIPGTTEPIAFAGRGLAFNAAGLASTNLARLVLVSEHSVDIGSHVTLTIPSDNSNYVEFDCNGFRSVNLKGLFSFDKGLLIPDVVENQDNPPSAVTATFAVNATDLNNMMISTSISPFQIKGLKDFSFSVVNAVVDMSDIINPPGFSFPQDYQQAYGEDITLWRGFYLQEVVVKLPKELASRGERASANARNLLIDELGVSGLFGLKNILNASADGWPFSVDSLGVQLVHNRLTGGGFAGNMQVPFLGKDSLRYQAMMIQTEKSTDYSLSLATLKNKEYSMPWSGKLTLKKGSAIKVESRDGKLIPSALLHGVLSIEATSLLQIKSIDFQNLGLTTQKPYLVSGVFGSGSMPDSITVTDPEGKKQTIAQPRVAKFPVSIDSIRLGIYQGQFALGLGVGLNLMGAQNSSDKGLSVRTFVQVLAKVEERTQTNGDIKTKTQHWEFDKVKISDISVSCHVTAFDLEGRLTLFDDDPVYGNGFRGNISFALSKIMKKPIQINAYFGSMPTYRYWHLDAYVPTGNIPVIPPVSITGILGGMSYHMTRPKAFVPDYSKLNVVNADTVRQNNPNNTETRNSGAEFAYVPDSTASLGFMAGVTLITGSDKAFNADVTLEAAFNQGGGLRYVEFKGDGYFFTAVQSRARGAEGKTTVPLYVSMAMRFDNDNDVLHANMKGYLNVQNVIRGTGANGLIGEIVIHADPQDWYIYVGRPSQMLGVNMANIATAKAYFMVGTKVEDLPLPPSEVAEVFDNIDLNFMRDENAISSGKGFALGVHIKVAKSVEVTPFYASLALGGGADVMLRNYGEKATCRGQSGTLGMNGWYASGQAYIFLAGKVGIRVGKRKRSFDIISLGAAALLQAKLPNPTWMRGGIAGKYSILGGLVKGKVNLTFTVGEECEIIAPGNELGDIEVIADISPAASSQDVSVFAAPQVSFNTKVGSELNMMNNQDQLNTYRIVTDEIKIVQNKQAVNAVLEWNEKMDVVALNTPETLPQETSLIVRAKIHWEKKEQSGWTALKDENGQIDYEVKESNFVTGKAPDYIPEENIAYSYPVKNQYHLYKKEHGQGYIKLKKGQAYLFDEKDNVTSWKYTTRFEAGSGTLVESPLSYQKSESTVLFALPEALANATVYKLTLIKTPQASEAVDANVKRSSSEKVSGDNTVEVTTNTLEGTAVNNVEKNLYASAFRTSMYNTLADKLNSLSDRQDRLDIASGNTLVIGKVMTGEETFDEAEIKGNGTVQPLVQVEASPDNNWYSKTIYPLLYEHYPLDNTVTVSRPSAAQTGVPPLKGVKLQYMNGQSTYRLTDNQVSAGYAAAQGGQILLGYYLDYYVLQDYSELTNKAIARYLDTKAPSGPGWEQLRTVKGYTNLEKGSYPVILKYVLPGSEQVTSSQTITIRL
ncbi:hypothetical protein [Xanthocytophaga flava]|uniref:hypothetical protein n=1 Tax=Xanthocytophaga flava TaxID=3048013 RepID=UPI0028D31387|nr:hypothetical protein [Xanthocytophaga flavus]MDJ1470992.1 hypothetical protein [Xanthocytophaga flavus]